MRGAHLVMGLVLCFTVLSGCNKKACERYCRCDDAESERSYYRDNAFFTVDPQDPNCEESCESALDEEESACRMAFRRAARCMDQLDCNADDCDSPIYDVESECDL